MSSTAVAQAAVQQLDPVPDRALRAGGEMQRAPDVRGAGDAGWVGVERAPSAYAGSSRSRSPYSLTSTPQPLAVTTTASAPLSIFGHQASIFARISRCVSAGAAR